MTSQTRTTCMHVFTDSDDLHDLRLLKQAVADSDVIVLVQSAHVLERP